MDIEEISKILEKARSVFEEYGNKISGNYFGDFPTGACGPASEIIGEWLSQNGALGLKCVSGTRGEHTHAWLEYKGYILDITSDQFDDGYESVFIGKNSKFHGSFKNRSKPDIGNLNNFLASAYKKFSEIMENT